ncbi:MAG: efflux RND transporter periplasmic adaptor subunit [Chitinivorax sp.]
MKHSKWVWGTLVVGGLLSAGYWIARGPQAPAAAKKEKGPPSVLVTKLRQGDVPLEIEATGQVAPLQLVEVRPQIAGQVRKVLIREGQNVQAGQPLFQLEDGSERAALEKARAQKARDEAQLADAQRILTRNRTLQQQNYVASSAVDSAASTVDSLKAAIAADIAAIRAAEVDLAYKTVSAQISGRSGAINVFPGSVVTPTQALAMTTIAQLDPISVSFNIAETALPQLFAAKSQQQLKVRASLVDTAAVAGDELQGQLSFIDNAVDSRSGTIRVKAQFDNRAGKLWPGMYVHLRLQAGVQKQALLLPVGAVQSGPDGKFAFVVGADKRLQARPLTLLAIRNEIAIVSGLQAGSVVVAGSGVNLRPGDQIKPKFATDKAGAKP